MNSNQIKKGQPQAHYNVAGTRVLKYTIELFHIGLSEHKLISAPKLDMLENKTNLQVQRWKNKWSTVESKRLAGENKKANQETANIKSNESVKAVEIINNLLIHTLDIDDTVDWNSLKTNDDYSFSKPSKPTKGKEIEYPQKPFKEVVKFSFLDIIFSVRKKKKINDLENKYSETIDKWNIEKKLIDEKNLKLNNGYANQIKQWKKSVIDWERSKDRFMQNQLQYNEKIDTLKANYFKKNPDSIVEYCDLVLNNSEYPESFPKDYELEYNVENKVLIVEYALPSMDCLPKIKEVKYIATKDELKNTYLSEAFRNKMFDDSMYKISLRTIHELFEADVVNAIDTISFNGWVNAINKATGKMENNCILSLQVRKSDFIDIDLSNVDPKTCFKSLKGVSSSKLVFLTPIKPILQISKNDKRFVESYEVASEIDTSTNLAAMDWEDFEHLIREIFEKEFQSNGGEVKVTQASRDGGVDAIAFDPNPIRGGKIVIQAKRYTNTVGVAAVRDLYGTVINEGANKGVLVTTADYGPDAYEFANGKPLELLNGSNLLHLLENHGYRAKVDLKEAKRILAEKEN